MRVRALNLFGGPGGFCEAARQLGISVLGVEHDPQTCATRMAAGHPTVGADVSSLDPGWFAPVDGLIASPPCPPFSRAGKRRGAHDLDAVRDATRDIALGYERRGRARLCADQRSMLVSEPWRWILALRPRWIALEQVPDVLAYWQFVGEGVRELGYSVWCGVLNAADYGTPQTRQRAFLIASLDRKVGAPAPTHADARKGIPMLYEPWVSMAQALGWTGELPAQHDCKVRHADEPAPTIAGARRPRWAYGRPALALTTTPQCREDLLVYGEWRQANHHPRSGRVGEYNERDIQDPSHTIDSRADLMSWRYRNGTRAHAAERSMAEPAPTLLFGHSANEVAWVRDRLATTVLATPRIGRPGHKDREGGESQFANDAIAVSEQEAAILQDFPPGYPFQGNKSQRFSQIGNAVPVRLARAVLAEATGETIG